MHQNVFVIGATGNVGSTLLKQISKKDVDDTNQNPTRLIWIASSNKFWLPNWGVPEEIVTHIGEIYWDNPDTTLIATKAYIKDILDKYGNNWSQDGTTHIPLPEFIKRWYKHSAILVDTTAEAFDKLHWEAISPQYGFWVVTANKKPVSMVSQEVFDKLTSNHWIYDFNTTVMAWWWAVNTLRRTVNTGDTVNSIEWCFSWTLWYIAAELEKWEKTFSEIVKEAKEKGYTEPNPWDDLNGLDVARKLIILIRSAWYKIEWSDIEKKVSPFIDKRYWNLTNIQEFMQNIKDEDKRIATLYKEAKYEGMTYKYVASAFFNNNQINVSIGLKKVPLLSPIGSLKGTSNIFVMYSGIYSVTPHIIISPWAGLALTADSLRDSIVKLLPKTASR